MSRFVCCISFFFLFLIASVGHAQVVDTVAALPSDDAAAVSIRIDSVEAVAETDDTIPSVDSLSLMRVQLSKLINRLDSTHVVQATMRHRMRELVALKDSLVYLNELYQNELQEKNRLMSEQVVAMQQKERLLAEKEELYRQALTSSSIDRAKWEGELKAKEASIEAKAREIEYLQKDIDAKEVTLRSQRENYDYVLTEKERYRHLVDSLQKRITAIEIENIRKQEENKYLLQKAKDAEEKAAISLNKKKKVRPIQGIALRFFRTPDWDTRLDYDAQNNLRGAVIRNKNSGDIEFDFVTGASVMLWDLSDYFNAGKDDTLSNNGRLPDIRRFDQKFNYDLGIYVGFGGSNLFKNFYIGPSFRFVDFFYLTIGVNICEYEILTDGYREGSLLQGVSLKDITAKSWLVKPYISLSIDLDFLSYIKK